MKVFQTKNTKFDMASQRMVSKEQEDIIKQSKKSDQKFNGLKSKKFTTAAGSNNKKWKNKSENFRNVIKAARTGTQVEMIAEDGNTFFLTIYESEYI